MKDKTKIWTDCPECAYKHLTAAYAFFTDPSIDTARSSPEELFLARAWVVFGEFLSGYKGNLRLAQGLLAAAETLMTPAPASRIREVRMSGMDYTEWQTLVSRFIERDPSGMVRNPSYLLGRAHLAEALRECPGLLGDFSTLAEEEVNLDLLSDAISWVLDTYELNPENWKGPGYVKPRPNPGKFILPI